MLVMQLSPECALDEGRDDVEGPFGREHCGDFDRVQMEGLGVQEGSGFFACFRAVLSAASCCYPRLSAHPSFI